MFRGAGACGRSRETGREVWEAKDLGLTPEMILAGGISSSEPAGSSRG